MSSARENVAACTVTKPTTASKRLPGIGHPGLRLRTPERGDTGQPAVKQTDLFLCFHQGYFANVSAAIEKLALAVGGVTSTRMVL